MDEFAATGISTQKPDSPDDRPEEFDPVI
jgi:hypothetical protein